MSTFLTDAELADVRAMLDGYLDTTCDLLVRGTVSDDAGGQTVTWTVALNDTPCRVEYPVKETTEPIEAGAVRHLYDAVFVIAQSAVAAVATGIRVGFASAEFQVIEVRGGHYGRELCWYLYTTGPV